MNDKIQMYQERIKKNTEKVRDEKINRIRTILQKKIQRDRISIELEKLKTASTNN
jgi:hypothetical protein